MQRRVVAALTSDRQSLTVAIVNPTETAQKINVTFNNIDLRDSGKKWEIAPANLQSRNEAGQEPAVKIAESAFDRMPNGLELAPLSITLDEFRVK